MSHALDERNEGMFARYLPGLVLVAIIVAAAYGLRSIPALSALSPMILAIMLGMLFANSSGVPVAAEPGMSLCGKRLLRAAVALLGLQLTFADVAQIGLTGVAGAAVALVSCFIFTLWLGRALGVSRELRYLMAGGVSICGASAAAAVGATIRAKDEDVSYTIACITLFGTVAMFAFPLLKGTFGLDSTAYGQWIGFSVHEVAQVVAAGFQHGTVDGEMSVVAKLTRVMMLAPVVVVVALVTARAVSSEGRASAPPTVPFFILAFVALMVANSFGIVPEPVKNVAVAATPILLTASLGALGLGTRLGHVLGHGYRPLLLAGISSLFIASVALLWVRLV